MKKLATIITCAAMAIGAVSCGGNAKATETQNETDSVAADTLPTVYYIKDITPENLMGGSII